MVHTRLAAFVAALCLSTAAFATTFVVPDDRELVEKSEAIVRGTVVRAWVDDSDPDYLRTMYELKLEKVVKGDVGANGMLTVASPGGVAGGRFLSVEGAAHLQTGEDVLLFLTWHRGAWTPTDLTVGKFRFVLSETGRGLLVRDADSITGWDRSGKVHVERARDEAQFMDFVIKTARGMRAPQPEYFTSDAISSESARTGTNAAPNISHTYSISFLACDLTRYPARWENMANGITYQKNSAQNASGLADGGVSVIETAVAAWSSDCNSAINATYGGTTTAVNTSDSTNAIVFNDPNNQIASSWSGSGVIAAAFTRGGTDHQFDGVDWIGITDADIVFQNGYAGTEPTIGPAMTHEMGHTLGFRHSNQHYLRSCTSSSPNFPCSLSCSDNACDSSVQECTSTAIMNSSVNGNQGYTLQTWDQHAAEALYPGGSCATPEPARFDFNADGRSDILWRHATTGENYLYTMNGQQVMSSTLLNVLPTGWSVAGTGDTDGDLGADIIWRNGTEVYLYRMYGNSIIDRGYVTILGDVNWRIVGVADFNGDNKDDILWRHDVTGENYLYLMNGLAITSANFIPGVPDLNWTIAAVADFSGDGKADIFWRHAVTGQNYMWLMNGFTQTSSTFVNTVSDLGWQVAGAGDFGGDGKADILWKYESEGQAYLYTMNGATVTSQGFVADLVDTNWRIAAIGDYNGDDKSDILWRHAGNGDNYMYLMNGSTISTASFVQAVPDVNWQVQSR